MNRKPNAIDVIIGKSLKDIRKKQNISQLKLVELLDYSITYQQIQKYEKGINRITIGRLYEYLEALNISLADFFAEVKII